MAERYHHGPHDTRSERSRRHKEMYANGMISEDHSAIANLPQEVRMTEYAQTGPWMPEPLDDTIRGVDKQMDGDNMKRRSELRPRKY